MGEDWYELEHSETALSLRTEAYGAVFGGCTLGRLCGNGVIWPFNSTSAASGNVQSPTWQSQLSSQGSTDQQRLGLLLRSREYWKLVPDISGTVMTASTGGVCSRTSDGQSILAYIPSSQTVTVDMTKITDSGSQAKCWWRDPTNRATTLIGTFSTTGTRNFTTPGNNAKGDPDWNLVLDSNAANLAAPG
jgi:hypothetical protein